MVEPSVLLNFGLAGVLLALTLAGWIWPKPSVDDIKAQRDLERISKEKAEAQRDALIETLNGTILPALRDANAGATKVTEVALATQGTLNRVEAALGKVEVLLLAEGR